MAENSLSRTAHYGCEVNYEAKLLASNARFPTIGNETQHTAP